MWELFWVPLYCFLLNLYWSVFSAVVHRSEIHVSPRTCHVQAFVSSGVTISVGVAWFISQWCWVPVHVLSTSLGCFIWGGSFEFWDGIYIALTGLAFLSSSDWFSCLSFLDARCIWSLWRCLLGCYLFVSELWESSVAWTLAHRYRIGQLLSIHWSPCHLAVSFDAQKLGFNRVQGICAFICPLRI